MSRKCPRCDGVGNLPGALEAIALRRSRSMAGISLRRLAKLVGISHVYLSDIELHRRSVSWKRLHGIEKAIDRERGEI